MIEVFDYVGQLTKNGLWRKDGALFSVDSFKQCDGRSIPIVYDWMMAGEESVLGKAILDNREDGLYAKLIFDESENAKTAKDLVVNNDHFDISFTANNVDRAMNGEVLSGNILYVNITPVEHLWPYEED